MRSSNSKKRTQTSFLLSLILHVIMALVLGIILIEPPQEQAAESLAVEMVSVPKRVTPPRRMERRQAWSSPRNPTTQKATTQFEPRRFEQIDTDFVEKPRTPDVTALLPELITKAERLKAKPDRPIPRAIGASIMKPSADAGQSLSGGGRGAGFVGLSEGAGVFETALYWIARNIASKNKTGKEDVVFLIDASGTMEDNIAAVATYISKMIDVFQEGDLDYTMGVVRFNRVLKKNDIKLYEQTADVSEIKDILRSIRCDGDERTLDAVEVGLTQVEFRSPVDKTFILVTDEPFTPRSVTRQTQKELTLGEMLKEDFREIVKTCQDDGVKVNVLGIDDEMHRSLAKLTSGLWFQIPQQGGSP
ncbi:VWA domain-containing protein [Candidatus Poribacteria bacterium]